MRNCKKIANKMLFEVSKTHFAAISLEVGTPWDNEGTESDD